jgi:hypothetical protein
MKTPKQYLEEYGPGEVKVRLKEWPPESYFIPYFVCAGSNYVIGTSQDKVSVTLKDEGNYEIWTEPKKKKTVVMYQWLIKDGDDYFISNHQTLDPIYVGRVSTRLEHTKLEVEVDDN